MDILNAHRAPVISFKGIWLAKLVCAILLMVIGDQPRAAEQCPQPLYGITFTHYLIAPTAHFENGRDSAKVMAEGAIIPQYDSRDVQERVRRDLAQIKSAGFTMIRTVLWFTQDRIIAPWGQLSAPLSADDARKIKLYGQDIQGAGFRSWLIVFGPGIRN